MTIPVQHDDDDFYINTTLADAQATIAALEETILKMGENAAVVAKDAMAAKEQVAALQGQVRELEQWVQDQSTAGQVLIGKLMQDVLKLEAQLTRRTAERDTARRRVDELEAREVDVVLLREDLEKRTAELEAATRERDEAAKDRDDWITSWRALQRHNERIEAALDAERDRLRAALEVAGDDICSEFCGSGPCHKKCLAVKAALTPAGGA